MRFSLALLIVVTVAINAKAQPSVDLIDPDGGQLFSKGTLCHVSWSSTDLPWQDDLQGRLALYPAGNQVGYYPGMSGLNSVDLSIDQYDWLIPEELPSGPYVMTIMVRDGPSVIAQDFSAKPFTVVVPEPGTMTLGLFSSLYLLNRRR